MEVGFIGLGRIGQAMARNLLKAGHRVFVYNRTRSRAEELRDEGAEVAGSTAGACKGDIVITMLADDDAVEEIVLGSGGVIKALREDAIHLSMSTITVGFSEVLTEAHHAVGQHFVAAPVFGRPEAAAAAKLFIVAAGEPEPLDRCKPLFDDLGQKTFVVDPFPPKANLVKLSREFSSRLGHRVPRRGDGADPQIRRRPGAFSRDPDGKPLCRSRLRDLQRTHPR